MVSDSEEEISFEDETEYEGTYFNCFILDNEAQDLDIDYIMEEITMKEKMFQKYSITLVSTIYTTNHQVPNFEGAFYF